MTAPHFNPIRYFRYRPVAIGVIACLSSVSSPHNAWPDTIELTVINQSGNSIEIHQWAQTLQNAGFDRVRIAGAGSAHERARPTAEVASGLIRVTGILDSANQLRLPGAQFNRRDRAGIAQWVDELRSSGGNAAAGPGFGFAPDELVRLSDRFAAVRVGATRGQDSLSTLTEIATGLSIRIEFSAQARSELKTAGAILDELEGLSAGTAMAAILRPWGLALVPAKRGGQLVLTVATFEDAAEFWPVGWPPREPINKTAPKLFQREQVEIRDVPLSEALSALQPLMELPFLLDHNGMARQDIDPDVERVSFPSARTLYKRVLDRALSQAKMKSEVRVDEAGQPFLWMAPIRDTP